MRIHRNKTILIIACMACIAFGPGSVARAYLPDPDNAALLYYQALLLSVQLEGDARDALFAFGRGEGELTDEIRQSARLCGTAIDYAAAAAELSQCNWGLRFSLGYSLSLPYLGPIRSLSHAILAEARIRAADGDYRGAFSRCLTVKKMGRHMGDETMPSLLVGYALNGAAGRCIRDLLGSMPADLETLQWLRAELALQSGRLLSIKRTMEYEREISMEIMRPEKLHLLVDALSGSEAELTDEQLAKMDEEFLARNRQYYSKFITSLETALSIPGGYARRYARLTELGEQLKEAARTDDAATLTATMAPAFNRVYSVGVAGHAQDNATRAAVDILLVKARTGRLPEALPADTPLEPFSDQQFEYEKTDTGFVLRCRGQDPTKDTVEEYTVAVK